MLERLATVFMTPRALLGKLPGKMFKEAHEAFTEVTKYFEELRAGAADDIQSIAAKKNKTILGKCRHLSSKVRKLTSCRGNRNLSG